MSSFNQNWYLTGLQTHNNNLDLMLWLIDAYGSNRGELRAEKQRGDRDRRDSVTFSSKVEEGGNLI